MILVENNLHTPYALSTVFIHLEIRNNDFHKYNECCICYQMKHDTTNKFYRNRTYKCTNVQLAQNG